MRPIPPVFAALMFFATAGSAQTLTVRTYDNTGIAKHTMIRARETASAILKNAGIEIAWRDCATDCAEPIELREVVVRIVAAPKGAAPELLGCALVDVRERSGKLATIYADRIWEVAGRAGVDEATLLGRAIAHEIAHLLLGTPHHSDAGLMRARWSVRELQRDLAADWKLSPGEAAQLRDHTRRRVSSRTRTTSSRIPRPPLG